MSAGLRRLRTSGSGVAALSREAAHFLTRGIKLVCVQPGEPVVGFLAGCFVGYSALQGFSKQ
jgi:hypothetical protein